ncbi:MAG: ubiquinol-cytochrome c reductase iron-sulfur subunit, partial [Georgfuchsia sp.]
MDKIFDNSDLASSRASQSALDPERRKILLAAASVAGGAALATASIPFIASMNPSEREKAAGAPVETDVSRLRPGAQMTVEWRGKPVWVLRRTDAMLKTMQDPRHLAKLLDPDSQVMGQQPTYVQNAFRSVKPEYLVVVGICTHLGCV